MLCNENYSVTLTVRNENGNRAVSYYVILDLDNVNGNIAASQCYIVM